MKIKQLNLFSIGRFKELTVALAPTSSINSNITILIGTNGGGKTTILKALAASLSWLGARIRSEKGSGSPISEDAILNGHSSGAIEIKLHEENFLRWVIAKTRPGRKNEHVSDLSGVSKLAEVYREKLHLNSKSSLPLIAFYPVERSVLDIPLKIKGKHTFSQLDGYENSLNQGVDFRRFFEWFREREDIENETGAGSAVQRLLERDPVRVNRILDLVEGGTERIDKIDVLDHRALAAELKNLTDTLKLAKEIKASAKDYQLDAVRKALKNFMPEFSNLRVQRKPRLQMSIDKNGKTFNVAQLSQGEKSLMALVGDIARRLAMLNPDLEDPLFGSGIVLIDEVDMHLHPQWARTIVSRLKETFPNCQFLLTTHSPLVISDCKDVLVYALDDGELSIVPPLYGEDANTVLLEVMDTQVRNAHVAKKLGDLLDLIQDRKIDEAEKLLAELTSEMPLQNVELAKARLLLRKEAFRLAKN